CFFFSGRRRHTSLVSDWSSDVCSSDLSRDQPIEPADSLRPPQAIQRILDTQHRRRVDRFALEDTFDQLAARSQPEDLRQWPGRQIGRASCRERVKISVVYGVVTKKS